MLTSLPMVYQAYIPRERHCVNISVLALLIQYTATSGICENSGGLIHTFYSLK